MLVWLRRADLCISFILKTLSFREMSGYFLLFLLLKAKHVDRGTRLPEIVRRRGVHTGR